MAREPAQCQLYRHTFVRCLLRNQFRACCEWCMNSIFAWRSVVQCCWRCTVRCFVGLLSKRQNAPVYRYSLGGSTAYYCPWSVRTGQQVRAAAPHATRQLLNGNKSHHDATHIHDTVLLSGVTKGHDRRERQRADTIGTVPFPWAGHF